MTLVFSLLTVQTLLGALDTLWNHEIAERLQSHGFGRDRCRRLLASLGASFDRLGKVGRDVGAGPVTACRVAFGEQLLIGRDHGGARHAKLRGKFAGGWQLRSRPQAP